MFAAAIQMKGTTNLDQRCTKKKAAGSAACWALAMSVGKEFLISAALVWPYALANSLSSILCAGVSVEAGCGGSPLATGSLWIGAAAQSRHNHAPNHRSGCSALLSARATQSVVPRLPHEQVEGGDVASGTSSAWASTEHRRTTGFPFASRLCALPTAAPSPTA